MAGYDVHGVFERLPQILGMPELTRKGETWEGCYYLNGDEHRSRRDKLKITKWNGNIWLHEEGGESISLPDWLVRFGGADDFKSAMRVLNATKVTIDYDACRKKSRIESLTISPDVLWGARNYPLEKCPLFVWMSTFFGADKVRAAWEKYNVTTDHFGNAVFWSVDSGGRILHDKIINYLPDGHRNHDMGAWRKYTIAKGYNRRCLFGAHLMTDDRVYCVESEKTALLFYLYYDRICVATGGKNALESDDRLVLVPDMDAREEWSRKGFVWDWWTCFEGVGDHWDIGDAIVSRMSAK